MTDAVALTGLAVLGFLSGVGSVCMYRRNTLSTTIACIWLAAFSSACVGLVLAALIFPLVGLLP